MKRDKKFANGIWKIFSYMWMFHSSSASELSLDEANIFVIFAPFSVYIRAKCIQAIPGSQKYGVHFIWGLDGLSAGVNRWWKKIFQIKSVESHEIIIFLESSNNFDKFRENYSNFSIWKCKSIPLLYRISAIYVSHANQRYITIFELVKNYK